ARPGDVLLLEGDLGAGKTSFARAFIRRRARADIEVPSPTFTLVQTYDLPGGAIWHFDLYRLKRSDDIYELAIEDAFAGGISLIEWPGKLGRLRPRAALEVAFGFESAADRRTIALSDGAAWADRLVAAAWPDDLAA